MRNAPRPLLLSALLLMAAGAAWAQESLSAVWSEAGVAQYVPPLRVTVDSAQDFQTATPLPLVCEIVCKRRFHQALVRFEVVSEAGIPVSEADLRIDLTAGANACTFHWDAADAPDGIYQARVAVHYAPGTEPATYAWEMHRVRSETLSLRLAHAEGRAAALRAVVPADNVSLNRRLGLAHRFAGEAHIAAAQGDWKTVAGHVAYVESSAQRIFDDVLLGSGREIDSHPRAAWPRFRFGRIYDTPDTGALHELAQLGLNYAVLALPPSATLSGPGQTKPYAAQYDPFFAAASAANVAVSVNLAPDRVDDWVFQTWPEIAARGTRALSLPGVVEVLRWHANSVLPYLDSQPAVQSVGVFDAPRYHFDSEQVRQAFIAHIKSLYPDRYLLNRTWHTQFGSYDEIGIWDDYRGYYDNIAHQAGSEEVRYQERRAYQFDWQRFHIALGNRHLAELGQYLGARSKKPLHITMGDDAFAVGESRKGIDRGHVYSQFDAAACALSASIDDPVFAMRFPDPIANCVLTRSLAPDKPLLLMPVEIDLATVRPGPREYGLVSTLLWETAMAGVSATALDADSAVFNRPHALEAFVVTAMDLNRLAGVVTAFQNDLPPIAVLYSESSRIFDDGDPHLRACLYAFEGCSFGGYGARFITEQQCAEGGLDRVKVLVIPQTPALADAAFDAIGVYLEAGGTIARVGSPIPYNERGESRTAVFPNTGNTVLVRGMNLPTEYLHAIDAAIVLGALPTIARPVNLHGYPLEGVKTRYIEFDGQAYLYVLNVRSEPVVCHLTGSAQQGHDLIFGNDVAFPTTLPPLQPMLLHLRQPAAQVHLAGTP